MENEFVKYEEAKALNELGFSKPCFGYYVKDTKEFRLINGNLFSNNSYTGTKDFLFTTPTYQQAFRWFRKEHGLYSAIVAKKCWPDQAVTGVEWYMEICGGNGKELGCDGVYSYEEAELALLKKLIQIVKENIQ